MAPDHTRPETSFAPFPARGRAVRSDPGPASATGPHQGARSSIAQSPRQSHQPSVSPRNIKKFNTKIVDIKIVICYSLNVGIVTDHYLNVKERKERLR